MFSCMLLESMDGETGVVDLLEGGAEDVLGVAEHARRLVCRPTAVNQEWRGR